MHRKTGADRPFELAPAAADVAAVLGSSKVAMRWMLSEEA
jgi:hypothetical protein